MEHGAAAGREVGASAVGDEVDEDAFFFGAGADEVVLAGQADQDVVDDVGRVEHFHGDDLGADDVDVARGGHFQIEIGVVRTGGHHHAAAVINDGGGGDAFYG